MAATSSNCLGIIVIVFYQRTRKSFMKVKNKLFLFADYGIFCYACENKPVDECTESKLCKKTDGNECYVRNVFLAIVSL